MKERKLIYEFVLPKPPSVNNYYGKPKFGNKPYIKKPARNFRQKVMDIIPKDIFTLDFPLHVEVEQRYGKAKKQMDIDNPFKGLFDALTHSNVWTDDKLVKSLYTELIEDDPKDKKINFVVRIYKY